MNEENKVLKCDNCNIHITEPHIIRLKSNGLSKELTLCKYCRGFAKEFLKFPKGKFHHNYDDAELLLKELHRKSKLHPSKDNYICSNCFRRWCLTGFSKWKGTKEALIELEERRNRKWNTCYCGEPIKYQR